MGTEGNYPNAIKAVTDKPSANTTPGQGRPLSPLPFNMTVGGLANLAREK